MVLIVLFILMVASVSDAFCGESFLTQRLVVASVSEASGCISPRGLRGHIRLVVASVSAVSAVSRS